MIVGLGIDVVDCARARRMIDAYGERLLARVCTPEEAAYVRSNSHDAHRLAVRLAAKEAGYKALAGSEHARAIGWREIEVVAADGGPPVLRFSGRAAARARELAVTRALLSLSHGDTTAVAVVILEGPGSVS